MVKVTLGSTGITVNKNGFGALPIQRISSEASAHLLRKAYEAGIDFYDTARFYTDSEEKIGEALSDVRDNIYIATKTAAQNSEDFWKDLATSLNNLKTDYIDIYQFHNPSFCPKPGDGTGLYETLQFPFNYLATDKEHKLVEVCREKNIGFIAMKALSGGLITNSKVAYAYQAQYDNVLPIWGVQRETELDEFISYIDNPPVLDEEIKAVIENDKKELAGNFCRGCGYCMPTCPAHIEINNCARMSLLLRRSPSELQLTKEVQAKMKKIEDCIHCGACSAHCPYGLDTPKLLEDNYKDYKEVLAGKPL